MQDEGGHDFVYNCSLQKMISRCLVNYQAFASKSTTLCNLPTNWSKIFRGRKWRVFDFLKLFLKKRNKTERRCFFLEKFFLLDLCPLTVAIFLFFRKGDSLSLLFRYEKNQRRGILYLFLIFLLKIRLGKNLVLLTDSELIAQSYVPYLNLIVMPIPHVEDMIFSRPTHEKVILWWPGGPRLSKGLQDIQKLAKESMPPHVELVVARSSLLQNESYSLNVRPVSDILSRKEYQQLMEDANIVLLPYDPIIYSKGTSGILVEAIIAGKMPFVKEGSWLSYELRRFSLEKLIIDWSKADLVKTILELYQDPELHNRLEKMRFAYTEFHSLKTYQDKLNMVLKLTQ